MDKEASVPPTVELKHAINLFCPATLMLDMASSICCWLEQKLSNSTKLCGKAWKSTNNCCSAFRMWKSYSEQDNWYRKSGS